ncbi:MAG: LPXTG cell wall anchor domain-containing protein [Streptococcus sp.]
MHDKTLPETGDKNQKLTSVAGIGILSVALAGLFTSYKRKH